MVSRFIVASLALMVGVAVALPAVADETGMATALHTVRKEGKLTCLADHWHYMSGDSTADKKKAIASAVDNWQGFTAAEYGTDWAYFRKAASKKISCSQSSSGWGCSVEGRPCK